MDISGLPNIALEGAFAGQLGVASNGLMRMVDEGTLLPPFARRGAKPVWSQDGIDKFFRVLHEEQSAYAPIDLVTGQSELDNLGVYVCPAVSSWHIGNRRPSYLALYKAGAPRNADGYYEIDVYRVLWLQTQQGVAGELLAAPKGTDRASIHQIPWNTVRPAETEPLALFKLETTSKRTLLVETGVRRGGTISTNSLLIALDSTPKKASHFKGGIVHLID